MQTGERPWLFRASTDRALLALTGSDRVRFLNGMITNDVATLGDGDGCHAAMLSQKGRYAADLVVYRCGDELWVETDASTRDKVAQILEDHIIADDVELVDLRATWPVTAIYGDDVIATLRTRAGLSVSCAPYATWMLDGRRLAAYFTELGVAGVHVFGAPLDAGLVARELSLDEFEALRVEAGTPRYGVDMDEERLFLEAGVADAVSFQKGCYLGQEVVARASSRGQINRKLVGLLLDGDVAVAAGTKLAGAGRDDAGHVTSSVISPALGRPIALAYVHRTLFADGTPLEVRALSGTRAATVTSLPFVKRA